MVLIVPQKQYGLLGTGRMGWRYGGGGILYTYRDIVTTIMTSA